MLFRCVAFSFRGSILYDEHFDVRFHCICTRSTAFLCKLDVHSIVNTRTSYGCAVKSLGLWSTESGVRFTRKNFWCFATVFQRVWIRRKLRNVDTNGPDEYVCASEWVSSNEFQWKSRKYLISCVSIGFASRCFVHSFIYFPMLFFSSRHSIRSHLEFISIDSFRRASKQYSSRMRKLSIRFHFVFGIRR